MPRQVNVFAARSNEIVHVVQREDARTLVADGEATWINSCRAVRLTKAIFDLRGASCSMNAGIIEANADGVPWATAIVAAMGEMPR